MWVAKKSRMGLNKILFGQPHSLMSMQIGVSVNELR